MNFIYCFALTYFALIEFSLSPALSLSLFLSYVAAICGRASVYESACTLFIYLKV